MLDLNSHQMITVLLIMHHHPHHLHPLLPHLIHQAHHPIHPARRTKTVILVEKCHPTHLAVAQVMQHLPTQVQTIMDIQIHIQVQVYHPPILDHHTLDHFLVIDTLVHHFPPVILDPTVILRVYDSLQLLP